MDIISDHFISYTDNDFIVKQEKLSDSDVSLNFQATETQESNTFFPSFISPKLRSMLDATDLTLNDSFTMSSEVLGKRRKPFKIIRDSAVKREVSEEDSFKVKLEPEKKFINNNRRDFRREVAKKKTQRKLESISSISSADHKLLLENFGNLNVDEKTRKKMLQMIRNRISAQNSRDRRKAYMQTLEYTKELLFSENNKLNNDKINLLQEVKKLQKENLRLIKENKSMLSSQGGVTENEGNNSANPTEDGQFTEGLSNFGQISAGLTLNDTLQVPKDSMNLNLSFGMMLSMFLSNKMDQHGDSAESTKVDSVNDKTEVSSSEWEENNDFTRKLSHSTMYSSFSSPAPDTAATLDKNQKNTFWNESMHHPCTMMDTLVQDEGESDQLFSNNFFVKLQAVNLNDKRKGMKNELFGEGLLNNKGEEHPVFKTNAL